LYTYREYRDVRKAALSHIAITKRHIPEIMKRARDVVVEVRRHTFTVLAANCELKHTTIAQRATLLLDGLKDREQSVRDACIGLCMAWMRAKDLNIVKFAEALDVEVAPEAISLVIKELFKVSPIDLSEIYECVVSFNNALVLADVII
jgi:condensin complex subunit 3